MRVCDLVRKLIVTSVLDTGEPPRALTDHIATCLRCQAVVASTRGLRRGLAGLPAMPYEAEAASSRSWLAVGAASLAVAVAMARRGDPARWAEFPKLRLGRILNNPRTP